MHVSIDAAGKSEIVLAVEDLFRLLCLKLGGETADFAVANANVETIDSSLIRPYDAHILYDQVEHFRHEISLPDGGCFRSHRSTGDILSWPIKLRSVSQRKQFRRANQFVKSCEIEHTVAKRLGAAMRCQ
jgi:hypothetical protein